MQIRSNEINKMNCVIVVLKILQFVNEGRHVCFLVLRKNRHCSEFTTTYAVIQLFLNNNIANVLPRENRLTIQSRTSAHRNSFIYLGNIDIFWNESINKIPFCHFVFKFWNDAPLWSNGVCDSSSGRQLTAIVRPRHLASRPFIRRQYVPRFTDRIKVKKITIDEPF